jgi:glucose dehydrogenase
METEDTQKKSGRWAHYILGLSALFFVGADALLVSRGGSWYYLVLGVALLALT